MSIRVVMLGDVVGLPGCQAVAQLAPQIRQRWQADLLIVNAENASRGAGLTPELYRMLTDASVDGITLGDHAYNKLQILNTLQTQPNISRPANLAKSAKGRRWMALTATHLPRNVYVVTVLGRLFLANMPADDPFATIDQILTELPEPNPIVIVEIHAQATSEKQALAWHCNGRVALVAGSHTHVPTADARILPPTPHATNPPNNVPPQSGTAYITDLGMCGAWNAILGRKVEPVLTKMTTSMPAPFDVASNDPRVSGVFVEIDPPSGLTTHVERVELPADPTQPPFSSPR